MPELTPDITWAKTAFGSDRAADYDRYAEYFAGDHALAFATPKFESAFGSTFASFAYNRCANVVDAMTDRMQVESVSSDDTALHTDAQAIWDANQMDDRQGQLWREQFAMADGYLYVEVDPDTGGVVMWPQSARHVRVRYDADHPGTVAVAAKHWVDPVLKRYRLNLYYPDRIEKYASRTAATMTVNNETVPVSTGDIGSYEPYEVEGEPWPLPLAVTDTVPIFHFPNNAGVNSYGISELHDVIPVQDALNKSLMDLLVAMEFAAFPQRWMVNVDTEAEGAEEAIRRFTAGIDRILELYGGEGVNLGEFSAANIAQYTEVVELFDTLISRVSKVPVHYLKMTGEFGSGVARRLAEAPFVAKIEDRQRSAGAILSEAMRYGVRLLRKGQDVPQGAIRVNWQPAAPISREEAIEMALSQKSLGMPFEQILKEGGYDAKQIEAIMKLKRAEQDAQRQMFDMGMSLNGSGAE